MGLNVFFFMIIPIPTYFTVGVTYTKLLELYGMLEIIIKSGIG